MSRKMYSNGRQKGEDRFVRHPHWLMNSPAWKSLSPTARCVEMELKKLYNGRNNGDIYLSVREAAKRVGVSPNTAQKALYELVDRGFIIPKQKGSFGWKKGVATSWILTEEKYNDALPTKNFMRWEPTPSIVKPNSKIKTQSQNMLPTVSSFNTAVLHTDTVRM